MPTIGLYYFEKRQYRIIAVYQLIWFSFVCQLLGCLLLRHLAVFYSRAYKNKNNAESKALTLFPFLFSQNYSLQYDNRCTSDQ